MRLASGCLLCLFLAACGPDSAAAVDEAGDGELATLGAALDDARILRFLNGADATVPVLDDDVGLDARAAQRIVGYVRGPDARLGTADDNRLDSVAELDSIPYVGAAALDALNRYVAKLSSAAPSDIRVVRAAKVADVPRGRPAPGTYRLHLIDVGTGLAMLVQGADFTALFDGGSTDDSAGISASGNKSRLLAYLYAALGPSADPACRPEGDVWPAAPATSPVIDHLFLSHPHQDHNNMLDEVLRCYAVRDVWDSGAINDTSTHAAFLAAVAAEPGVRYHTATAPPSDRTLHVFGQTIRFPSSLAWTTFRAGDRAALGAGALFRILHADGGRYLNQYNDNSIVLRMDLGATSVLFAADAEAGPRDSWLGPVGEVEALLLEQFAADLDVDILQVGHHGSRTSSRKAFLDAVSPRWALVSAGPTLNNGGVSFPEEETIVDLAWTGAQVLRTDLNDGACPEADRVGVDDGKPGGCDNFVLELGGR
jgi:competence protein ComEC